MIIGKNSKFSYYLVLATHCLIVKCRGLYEKQVLSDSRIQKVDKTVLQEQFLVTSRRWCIHLKKKFFVVVILRFFLEFLKLNF